jgi:hypothetical protein
MKSSRTKTQLAHLPSCRPVPLNTTTNPRSPGTPQSSDLKLNYYRPARSWKERSSLPSSATRPGLPPAMERPSPSTPLLTLVLVLLLLAPLLLARELGARTRTPHPSARFGTFSFDYWATNEITCASLIARWFVRCTSARRWCFFKNYAVQSRTPLWIHVRKPYPYEHHRKTEHQQIWRFSKSPMTPRRRRERRLPLNA